MCVCVCCFAVLSVRLMSAALAPGGLVLRVHLCSLPARLVSPLHCPTLACGSPHARCLTRAPHLTSPTPAGGGQRLLGVPALPRLLRRGLHCVLQLRPLPQGGEPSDLALHARYAALGSLN